MLRTANLLLRVIVIGLTLSMSLSASALPLSPKWMKSSTEGKKVAEPSGELDIGRGSDEVGIGGGVRALPVPASIWLFIIGGVGMAFVRRRKG